MLVGIDVSHHQVPGRLDWIALKNNASFVIARASYGSRTADRAFVDFADRVRDAGLVFGVYHFYRQTQSVEEQLSKFELQLDLIGGLREGEMFPILDMEDNRQNGDGVVNAAVFSEGCQKIAHAWVERFGGVGLYYSSYFPEHLKSHKDWIRTMPNAFHWLADYGDGAKPSVPGQPRTPYTDKWHIHQHAAKPSPLYPLVVNGKAAPLDLNVLNPAVQLGELCIKRTSTVSEDAFLGERDTDERPGGAVPEDYDDALEQLEYGAESILQGLRAVREIVKRGG